MSKRPNRTSVRFVLGRLGHPIDFGYLVLWRLLGWPRQSWREIQLVKAAVRRPAPRVFEWGLGTSTIWYTRWLARQGADFHWYGVDHHPAWCAWVSTRTEGARVHLRCEPFEWRPERIQFIPTDEHRAYIDAPLRLGGQFDLLLIDGRFRRRCVETAMQVVAPGGVVLLCDAHRQYYHCTLAQHGGRFIKTGHVPGVMEPSLAWVNHVGQRP